MKTVKVTLFCGQNNNGLTVAEEESEGTLVSRAQTALFQGAGSLGAEKKPLAAGNVHPASDYAEKHFKGSILGFVYMKNKPTFSTPFHSLFSRSHNSVQIINNQLQINSAP